ncbi:sigma-70 family RNA polymerase sigma factor [Micromonospora sp. NPDC049559]|uniref:RNA polymerase sigma factor n=1 Tax=Micromonospora sp. NPDC049559 TaxID=3155923 RepID=UPI00342D8110
MARAAPAPSGGDARTRFEALYRAHYQDLLGYALRRCDRPEDAADVVAETFLVAWRRLDVVPVDQARAWLFGVARNAMANQHRADRRRTNLAARLRSELAQAEVVRADVPDEVRDAFRELPEADRELLRLVAWEGLSTDELTVALDCSANAVRIRLHRARRRFADALRRPSLTA